MNDTVDLFTPNKLYIRNYPYVAYFSSNFAKYRIFNVNNHNLIKELFQKYFLLKYGGYVTCLQTQICIDIKNIIMLKVHCF